MKQNKIYVLLINDHSGSMSGMAKAAMKDYNVSTEDIKHAATVEKVDTIVSVIGIGSKGGSSVERQIVISNPHVLLPKTDWPCPGGTPLYDAIADGIDLITGLPDAKDEHVSVLVRVTTDGAECSSIKYAGHDGQRRIAERIKEMQATGRWTFVFRVPQGAVRTITPLGVPEGNIQEWETSARGMEATTLVNTQAMTSFFNAKASGAKSSNSFYTNTAAVNLAALTEVPAKEISLYVVDDAFNGKWIRDFILSKRMNFLKGSAFFQLTKTEAKVGIDKMILIRDRATGKFFGGKDARTMIGMPTDRNARLNPGDHGAYDIFVQSKSLNRHLVAGTGVAYWEKVGTEFTQADRELVEPKPALPKTAAPGPVQLPQVAPTNKPTKSPLVPTPRPKVQFFATRDEARQWSKDNKKPHGDAGAGAPKGQRYFINP